ncbi:putative ankyrin repeat protein RF_0381 [Mytilus californianus]|uniref:putative ankyrin repeat protein RF_0381 n=1 Tax=Mytilus californianus TaxID=6549 RepID=UPI0022457699|nr:putative ankyrin repeat protein RF_0381 [Mytilus californianus]
MEEKGAGVNVTDIYGQTPLTLSCRNDNSDIIRLLIEKGADVNASDHDGQTPLMWSCANNNSDIVRLLIERGANVNVSNEKEQTLLILSFKGEEVNVRDFEGMTALSYASKNGFLEIVEELILNGAGVILADTNGKTPLINVLH